MTTTSNVSEPTVAAAADRMLRREVAPAVLTAAAKAPVDAIVFFKRADTPSIRSAVNSFRTIEQMPLGTDRKVAAFNAISSIGNATIDANMPAVQSLVDAGKITSVDRLWSQSAVRVQGASLDAIKALVGPNVKRIVLNDVISMPDMPNTIADPIRGAQAVETHPEDPTKIYMDWGTSKMGAPAAWAQGITGAGVVVGSIDTGVMSTHSGLKANFRGTNADGSVTYDHNMGNFIEKGAEEPIDDVGHGTHTVGSVLGNDAHHLTGVAPDAKFIHARGLGEKGGTMFALMAAMEWMMAPTDVAGKNPKPELAPDLITNSWGGGTVSNPFLWTELRNWRRAGIIPVFAAGNDRHPKPAAVAAPGLYGETITVGATDPNDKRAYFSMYGPSNFAKDRKPEIGAPGTKIYSTVPDGTYRDTIIVDGHEYPWSGTSMATPHVAGAVALYLQAHPGAKYDEVLKALEAASTQFTAPDQELGYGRVQVDKLITASNIDPKAVRTDAARVSELMNQVKQAEIYEDPTKKPEVAAAPVAAK